MLLILLKVKLLELSVCARITQSHSTIFSFQALFILFLQSRESMNLTKKHIALNIFTILSVMCFSSLVHAQNDSLLYYQIHYFDENAAHVQKIGRQSLLIKFPSKDSASNYLDRLPMLAASEGFLSFSVDEILAQDSLTRVKIFLGPQINTYRLDIKALRRLPFLEALVEAEDTMEYSFNGWKKMQQSLLDACENHGYPFAAVGLTGLLIAENNIRASVSVNENVFYTIDSISVKGNAKIKNRLLQKHLFMTNGMPYDANKLKQVDRRIGMLGYVSAIQPSDITMLGTGAVLNLYLKPRKISQFNFLLGLQPENGGKKVRLTGDLNVDLRNLYGSGEQLLFKWQQIQPQSPRLLMGYSQPYVFRSSFGVDTRFELFRKDSSFLQLNASVGTSFVIDAHQQGGAMLSWQSNRLLNGSVDTLKIINTRSLPQDVDMAVTSLGMQYQLNTADDAFNPRKGTVTDLKTQAGLKRIRANNDVLSIRTPGFDALKLYDSLKRNDFQIRMQATVAHYFPIARYSTIKTALQGGAVISRSLFRNESFQLGGMQLLRGFDAESIFARNYLLATIEYRFLFGKDAYFALFSDWARARAIYGKIEQVTDFWSAGTGLQYRTQSGLLNLNIAIGKRMDIAFDIRSAVKLHFGYINYF
jgi:outer membrane protein assembly factor BamA